jgi:hypothetical protein
MNLTVAGIYGTIRRTGGFATAVNSLDTTIVMLDVCTQKLGQYVRS